MPAGTRRQRSRLGRTDGYCERPLKRLQRHERARRHSRNAASQPRRRAVGPRCDPALGPLALRPRDRRGPAARGLLPRAPRPDLRGDAGPLQRERTGRRAHRDRPPAPDGQARGRRRTGDGGRAHRRRPRRGPRAQVRADRARERADAPAPADLIRDPGERLRPRRSAARARGAGGEGDARGRSRRPQAGLPLDRGGPARRARQACTSSRPRAPR